MAATFTLPEVSSLLNSSSNSLRPIVPARGVITLYGYGIAVRTHRGHLLIEDGIGRDRRSARFPRVGHGVRRLVVVSTDGFISLSALRWIADQKVGFVMLDREGTVLMASGPTGTKDARLRRAQSLAVHTDAALPIVRSVIAEKLHGQESVVRQVFQDEETAEAIAARTRELASALTVKDLRLIESRAALAYWLCWRAVNVAFPTAERARIPGHWQTFGMRVSPLTGSPRLAVNPANAILNYLYAMLEAEARLAAIAVGLDPGLGLMHADTPTRDSLACDIMEAVRPQVDAYVLRWLTGHTLRREWFFEERNGNCRLMASFVERLSETAPTWARAVAPVAERIAKSLWATTRKPIGWRELATPLTQGNRRLAKHQPAALPPPVEPAIPPRVCGDCGVTMKSGQQQCRSCYRRALAARVRKLAKEGQKKSRLPEARAKHSQTKRRQDAAARAWDPATQPEWLTENVYAERIGPALLVVSAARIAQALGVSVSYATGIKKGLFRPHPRHWSILADLASAAPTS